MTPRWWSTAIGALLRRPRLWATAVQQLGRLAVPGWWRRPPFLPVPDAAYLRFRMITAYGDPLHEPEPGDLVTYLEWCRAWPRHAS
jgi:hypothetical protein